MPSPKKADWPVVAAVLAALVLVPLGVYVGGYFALSRKHEELPGLWVRFYGTRWQAEIYAPAAQAESAITGDSVTTFSFDTR